MLDMTNKKQHGEKDYRSRRKWDKDHTRKGEQIMRWIVFGER